MTFFSSFFLEPPAKRVKIAEHENNGSKYYSDIGFTDEIDEKAFGTKWNVIRGIKHNDLTIVELNLTNDEGSKFDDQAEKRLGWYIKNSIHLQKVSFSGCQYISDENMARLFGGSGSVDWSENKSIHHVNFHNCSFGVSSVKKMLPFLKSLSNIEYLIMNRNQIGSEGFELVVQATSERQLKQLAFNDCGIENISPLKDCHFPQLELFNICNNKIGDGEVECISNHLLSTSTKLQYLHLQNCGIGDQGARSIINALASNKSLQKIFFAKNDISTSAVALLSKALVTNHVLELIDMSQCCEGCNACVGVYQCLQRMLDVNTRLRGNQVVAEWTKKEMCRFYHCDSIDDSNSFRNACPECPVCFSTELHSHALDPCGHINCSDCVSKLQQTEHPECPSCRKPFRGSLKLHLGNIIFLSCVMY